MAVIAQREDGIQPATFAARAERVLKLHAVLGSPIALSDIQLVDSAPILRMFSDAGFREFLKADPEWLALVTRHKEADQGREHRHAAANTGLRRSISPGWVSSAFPTVDGTVAFVAVAEKLLELGPKLGAPETRSQLKRSGLATRLAAAAAGGQTALEGLIHAYTFMGGASESTCIMAPTWDDSHQYCEQLDRFRGRTDLEPGHEEVIDETIAFIDKRFEGDKNRRNQRSLLQRSLSEEPDPEKQRRMWHTAVHAYNHANVQSLGVRGGAHAFLSHEVPIAGYDDAVSGLLVDGDIVKSLPSGRSEWLLDHLLGGPDLSSLSWNDIAAMVQSKSVADSRRIYRSAIASIDLADDDVFLRKHVKLLTTHIVAKVHTYRVFGGGETIALLVADLVSGQKPAGGSALVLGAQMRARVLGSARRYQVMETLRRYRH